MNSREELKKLIGPAADDYDEAQLEEAEANLRDYVALVLRVLERIELDPEATRHFEALTAARRELRMKEKDALTNSDPQQ